MFCVQNNVDISPPTRFHKATRRCEKGRERNYSLLFVSEQDLEKLMHAFASSRLDYCNALFTGLPKKTIRRLPLIQNAVARILTKSKRQKSHQRPGLCIGFQYNPE
jgi:hypothetical protein